MVKRMANQHQDAETEKGDPGLVDGEDFGERPTDDHEDKDAGGDPLAC